MLKTSQQFIQKITFERDKRVRLGVRSANGLLFPSLCFPEFFHSLSGENPETKANAVAFPQTVSNPSQKQSHLPR